MTTEKEIQELLRRAREGGGEAFERLLGPYRLRIEALVGSRMRARLGCDQDREDVLQETFLRALKAIDRFEWRGEDSS